MLQRAIQNAYDKFDRRNYDFIYLALDIHGTCADADYHHISSSLYDVVKEPLRVISELPEVKIILFSCCWPKDYQAYIDLFADSGIKISYFNCNPEIPNTATGCFDSKFYYDIIFEDKGGFHPSMMPSMLDAFLTARQFNKRVHEKYGERLSQPVLILPKIRL